MGKTRHGQPPAGDTLREFVQSQDSKWQHLAPALRASLGRTDGPDRTKPDPPSRQENDGKRGRRSQRGEEKTAAVRGTNENSEMSSMRKDNHSEALSDRLGASLPSVPINEGRSRPLRPNGVEAEKSSLKRPEEQIVEIAQKVSKSTKRTAASVLAHIASLADRKDYFNALERALRENVDVLVPAVMSMPDWSKALQNVHETNLEAAGGIQSEDPLGEIRKFLSGGEAA